MGFSKMHVPSIIKMAAIPVVVTLRPCLPFHFQPPETRLRGVQGGRCRHFHSTAVASHLSHFPNSLMNLSVSFRHHNIPSQPHPIIHLPFFSSISIIHISQGSISPVEPAKSGNPEDSTHTQQSCRLSSASSTATGRLSSSRRNHRQSLRMR